MKNKIILMTFLLTGLIFPVFAGPLHDAAYAGDTAMVRQLLKRGANIEEKNENGMQPLQLAAIMGHNETVELLLDHGANINARRNPAGETPLTQAVEGGQPETVKLLLCRGADPDLVTRDGMTALKFARVWGNMAPKERDKYAEIERLLLNAPQLRLEYQKAQIAAREQESRLAAAKVTGQIAMLKNAPLDQLLGKQELDNGEVVEALTDAIITAKNKQLPDFLATATSDQKVDLLTAVEKQIARATAGIDEANADAGTAVSKGQDPAPIRKRAGQIKAYINVLNEIKAILEQS
jgi:hypothetical protein